MLPILALAIAAVLLGRVAGAPRGTWRFVVVGAGVLIAATQMLPSGHGLRVDLGFWIRWFGWGAIAALPVLGYAVVLRGLRRRAVPAPVAAVARPEGLVLVPEDAALVAQTRAALEAEAPGAALSLGWRSATGEMVGHLRMRLCDGLVEIETLWVAQAARGAGIGARLLGAAEDEARAREVPRMAVALAGGQRREIFVAAGYGVVFEREPGMAWLEKELR